MNKRKSAQNPVPNGDDNDIPTDTLAETEDYIAWVSEEPDGESVYHVELGQVTLHFFEEEWEQLVKLIKDAEKNA